MRLLLALTALLGIAAPAAEQPSPPLPEARVFAAFHANPRDVNAAFLIGRGETSQDGHINVVVPTDDPIPRPRPRRGRDDGRPTYSMDVWASVTKQVVAVMVMQQVEAGRLSLDAPSTTYLPNLRGAARAPTIRELLQHRSGLWNPDDSPTRPDGWQAFYLASGDPLRPCLADRRAPGGQWRYNNCDYLLLGRILERATGRSLSQLFRERIATPAGLVTARFASDRPHVKESRNWSATDQRVLSRFGAAGGLVGEMQDLFRFDRALITGRLLSAASREALWRGDPALGYMALGQWVFDAKPTGCAAPLHIVERRGGIRQYQVRNIIIPERDLVVIMFVWDENFDFGEIWQGRGLSHDVLAAAACT